MRLLAILLCFGLAAALPKPYEAAGGTAEDVDIDHMINLLGEGGFDSSSSQSSSSSSSSQLTRVETSESSYFISTGGDKITEITVAEAEDYGLTCLPAGALSESANIIVQESVDEVAGQTEESAAAASSAAAGAAASSAAAGDSAASSAAAAGDSAASSAAAGDSVASSAAAGDSAASSAAAGDSAASSAAAGDSAASSAAAGDSAASSAASGEAASSSAASDEAAASSAAAGDSAASSAAAGGSAASSAAAGDSAASSAASGEAASSSAASDEAAASSAAAGDSAASSAAAGGSAASSAAAGDSAASSAASGEAASSSAASDEAAASSAAAGDSAASSAAAGGSAASSAAAGDSAASSAASGEAASSSAASDEAAASSAAAGGSSASSAAGGEAASSSAASGEAAASSAAAGDSAASSAAAGESAASSAAGGEAASSSAASGEAAASSAAAGDSAASSAASGGSASSSAASVDAATSASSAGESSSSTIKITEGVYEEEDSYEVEQVGECVPYYLCKDGDIITDGAGLIDIRLFSGGDEEDSKSNSQCPNFLDVLCRDPLSEPDPEIMEELVNYDYVPSCGHRNPEGVGFILDGFKEGESQFAEFPWMAIILEDELMDYDQVIQRYVCGASLIHPQVVMTGAHCVNGKDATKLIVRLGDWDTQNAKEIFPHEQHRVASMEVHERFNKANLRYDVALLFLEEPVELKQHIDTLCLPEDNEDFDYSSCVATGFGKDQFHGGRFQNIMKQVDLSVVPQKACQKKLQSTRLGRWFRLHRTFTCAGGEGGVDTCRGDGGSPLACPSKEDPSKYVQAGIVAWGIGCGEDGVPGVYASVPKLVSWVNEKIGAHFGPTVPLAAAGGFADSSSISHAYGARPPV